MTASLLRMGFTGTRHGMTGRQKALLRGWLVHHALTLREVHHGLCRGADVELHQMLGHMEWDGAVHCHPGPPGRWRSPLPVPPKEARMQVVLLDTLPPLQRNRRIVRATQVLVAAPQTWEEQLRSGTWATIRYARKIGRDVVVLRP